LNANSTHNKNNELTQYLTQMLIYIEIDQELKENEKIQYLLDQLLILEQQICSSVRNYNNSCEKAKKPKLKFDCNCDNKALEVK